MTQLASYWSAGHSNKYAQKVFNAPRVIKVRWEDNQSIVVNSEGEEVRSKAVIYSSIELVEEGYLMLGETISRDPIALERAYKIMAVAMTPSLDGHKMEIRAWL